MNEFEEISQHDFERIERYLLNQLSEQDRNLFEGELNHNPVLNFEVERQRQLMQAVEVGALREELKSISSKYKGNRVVSIRTWLSAAAAVLIAIGAFWWLMGKVGSSDDLYAQWAKPDPGLAVPMSSSTEYSFYDAMVDYKNEQYELAIQKWQPQLLTDADNDTLMYFIGAAYFNQQKFTEAGDYYRLVRKNTASSFYHKAGFYLSLMAYHQHQQTELSDLAKDTTSPYYDKILRLQESITKQ